MTFFLAPLFDSWIELMKNSSVLVGVLFTIQLVLSVIFFYVWKNCKINRLFHGTAEQLSGMRLLSRVIIFWILSTYAIAPYLSFIIDSLFVVGFVIILILPIVYLILLFVGKVKDSLFGEKAFYYLQHFILQQIIGLIAYLCIFKVRFWEIVMYEGDDKRFWLENIHPELGVLNRYFENFLFLLVWFGFVYVVWGAISGINQLVKSEK